MRKETTKLSKTETMRVSEYLFAGNFDRVDNEYKVNAEAPN